MLWYVFLRLGSYINHSVSTLYAIHFIFAACAAGFALSLRSVPLALRVALVLGGFLGHEFAVVARNYAPAVAALLAYAFFYPQRNERPFLLGGLLAFAINVHAGVIPIVPCLLLPWCLDSYHGQRRPFLIAAAIVAFGFILAVWSIYPPYPDSIFRTQLRPDGFVLAEYLPSHQLIPVLTIGLSDLNEVLELRTTPALVAINLGFGSIVFFMYRTWIVRSSALSLVIATSLFYGLSYPYISYRHSGLLIIALFIFISMEADQSKRKYIQTMALVGYGMILAVQLIRIPLAYSTPFSTSQHVHAILARPEYQSARLICLPDWMGQTIALGQHGDCFMAFVNRVGPYPTFLLRDYVQPRYRLKDLTDWMAQQEASGRPGLLYLYTPFRPKMPQEPAEFGQAHRHGKRFTVLSTQAEIHAFLERVEEISPAMLTLSQENCVLLRLKPEYRGVPAPSALPRTDL